jgi:hypothetical protein
MINKLKEEERDLWYKRMGERTPINPDNELFISWMDYFDLMDECKGLET